jgi:hypothetical protein
MPGPALTGGEAANVAQRIQAKGPVDELSNLNGRLGSMQAANARQRAQTAAQDAQHSAAMSEMRAMQAANKAKPPAASGQRTSSAPPPAPASPVTPGMGMSAGLQAVGGSAAPHSPAAAAPKPQTQPPAVSPGTGATTPPAAGPPAPPAPPLEMTNAMETAMRGPAPPPMPYSIPPPPPMESTFVPRAPTTTRPNLRPAPPPMPYSIPPPPPMESTFVPGSPLSPMAKAGAEMAKAAVLKLAVDGPPRPPELRDPYPDFEMIVQDGHDLDATYNLDRSISAVPFPDRKVRQRLFEDYTKRHGQLLSKFPASKFPGYIPRDDWLRPSDLRKFDDDSRYSQIAAHVRSEREIAEQKYQSALNSWRWDMETYEKAKAAAKNRYDLQQVYDAGNARQHAYATGGGVLAGSLLANLLHRRYRSDKKDGWERPLTTLAGGVGGGALGYGISQLFKKTASISGGDTVPQIQNLAKLAVDGPLRPPLSPMAKAGAEIAKAAAAAVKGKKLKQGTTNTIGNTAKKRQVGPVTRGSKGKYIFHQKTGGGLKDDPAYSTYSRTKAAAEFGRLVARGLWPK